MKPIIFFIITLATLTYFMMFWKNRKTKVKFNVMNQEMEINLGLLSFALFLDGAILAVVMVWLVR